MAELKHTEDSSASGACKNCNNHNREKLDRLPIADAIKILREELRQKTDGYTTYLSYGGKGDHGEEVYLDALAMAVDALANGVTVQEWIPVSERLPKNDYAKPWWERQRYLVSLQNGTMRVATYGYKEYDWWIDSHDCVLDKKRYRGVTHWMPLPQTPKGE